MVYSIFISYEGCPKAIGQFTYRYSYIFLKPRNEPFALKYDIKATCLSKRSREEKSVNVGVIGAGYVGLTTSCVLAEFGHRVLCVDKNHHKLNQLKSCEVPFYEPGLQEMLERNVKKGHLSFTNNTREAIQSSEVVFIAVGTPPLSDGSPNLTFIQQVVDEISQAIEKYTIIVTKSTVPLGTNEWMDQALTKKVKLELFDVVSNPEFLKEGTAIQDTISPDRMVIGAKNEAPVQLLKTLFSFIKAPYYVTTLTGAEMIKYASNVFLAMKISYINEISTICEAYGVDVNEVAQGIGADQRIGPAFLKSGLGYGGSCLPKDLQGLIFAATRKNINTKLLPSIAEVNDQQVDVYMKKLEEKLGSLNKKRIAVWGLSFKPNTDDIRHSQAIMLIERLKEEGADVVAYDPIVKRVNDTLFSHRDKYDVLKGADALVLATDWQSFIDADWRKVKTRLKGNVVMDCRNALQREKVTQAGMCYVANGQQRSN